MKTKTRLLNDIIAYCEASGVSPTTFGKIVLKDGNFVGRLRKGGGCTVDNYDKVVSYMKNNPADADQSKSSDKREAA